MKTTKNLNQIAKVTFASVTFLFASLMPMQAASVKSSNSEMNEIKAASTSLPCSIMKLKKLLNLTHLYCQKISKLQPLNPDWKISSVPWQVQLSILHLP